MQVQSSKERDLSWEKFNQFEFISLYAQCRIDCAVSFIYVPVIQLMDKVDDYRWVYDFVSGDVVKLEAALMITIEYIYAFWGWLYLSHRHHTLLGNHLSRRITDYMSETQY